MITQRDSHWSVFGLATNRKGGPSESSGIPDASNLRVYIEGDNLDGMSNTTLVNGVGLAAISNLGTLGGTFVQAVALNQPTYSTTAGPGGTKSAISYDGGDSLVSSLAASSWIFMHDGTGVTIYTIMKTGSVASGIVSTKDSSNAVGVMHGINTFFRARCFTGNGSALNIATNSVNNALGTGTTFNAFASRIASASSPNYDGRINGVSAMTVASGGTFGSGAPQGTLTIGSYVGGTAPLTGSIRRVFVYAGYHSDATEAAVLAFSRGLDGVASYPAT